jgi:hypothetical protein
MVSEDKGTSSKKLYSFIKSKKCDGSGVAPLKKDEKYMQMHQRKQSF